MQNHTIIDENTIAIIDCHKFSSNGVAARAHQTDFDIYSSHLYNLWDASKEHTNLQLESAATFVCKRDLRGPAKAMFFSLEEMLPSWKGDRSVLLDCFEQAALIIVNDSSAYSLFGQTFVNAVNRRRSPVVRSADRRAPLLAPYAFLEASGVPVVISSDFESSCHKTQLSAALTNDGFVKAAKEALVYRMGSADPLPQGRIKEAQGGPFLIAQRGYTP